MRFADELPPGARSTLVSGNEGGVAAAVTLERAPAAGERVTVDLDDETLAGPQEVDFVCTGAMCAPSRVPLSPRRQAILPYRAEEDFGGAGQAGPKRRVRR
jgi:hypothetical protein